MSAEAGRRDFYIVLALYVVSTALYAVLGLRFDAGTAQGYMQFIDPELRATRLLESLWYYHANPPLLNLLVGISDKLFGAHQGTFLSLCFHLLGALTAGCVYLLTLKLSGSRVAAVLVTGLLLLNPDFVMYENWLMYTFPTAALLTMSAWALYRYVETRNTKWGGIFFGLLAALLLVRSLYHIAWMALVAALLALTWRQQWRQIVKVAAIPLLIVALWYGKNLYLFGTFSSSTWMGLGLTNIAILSVPRPELEELVKRHEVSPLVLVSRYEDTPLLFPPQQHPTGIPILDRVRTSTGYFNWNYQQIIPISAAYARDGLRLIRLRPEAYAGNLGIANRLFFSPSNVSPYFGQRNIVAVEGMQRILLPVLYGVPAKFEYQEEPHYGYTKHGQLKVNTSIPLIVMWVLVLGYGYVQARQVVSVADPQSQARAFVAGFITFSAVYLYVLGTALESGENYRYRFDIEPLFFVLTATALVHLVRLLRERCRPASEAAPLPKSAAGDLFQ